MLSLFNATAAAAATTGATTTAAAATIAIGISALPAFKRAWGSGRYVEVAREGEQRQAECERQSERERVSASERVSFASAVAVAVAVAVCCCSRRFNCPSFCLLFLHCAAKLCCQLTVAAPCSGPVQLALLRCLQCSVEQGLLLGLLSHFALSLLLFSVCAV